MEICVLYINMCATNCYLSMFCCCVFISDEYEEAIKVHGIALFLSHIKDKMRFKGTFHKSFEHWRDHAGYGNQVTFVVEVEFSQTLLREWEN